MYRNFLVVSGNSAARESLGGSLREAGYTVTLAASGSEAQMVVRNVSLDAALIDSSLTDMKAERLRERLLEARPDCQIVILTSYAAVRNTPELLKFGRDDYLVRSDQLIGLVRGHFDRPGAMASSPMFQRGNQALIEVIDVLVGLLELRERFFGGCSHQAMKLAREVAEEMACDEETIDEIIIATLLRDIGKAGVERDVLDLHGEFDEKQRARMRGHVDGSLRLLEHIDFPWKVLPVIRHHHERYDGNGYPDGLKGREIPIGARIVHAVDTYVALVSDRPHREAMSADEALDELIRMAGTHADPEVVEVMLRVLEKRQTGRQARSKPMILLVDEQEEFRNLMRLRLLNEGMDVETVKTPAEALEKLIQSPPDLILADVASEASDAFQLLREIREDESLRHVPYACLSGSDNRILKVRALRQGVDDFLHKGDEVEELVARVENILIRESIRRDGGAGRRRRGITGDLQNFALPDIVQTLSIGMKTAQVSLSAGKKTGCIWFEEGNIRHAKSGRLSGEKAFYDLVRWEKGEFVIEHGVRTEESTITHDAMFLLMEGLRLLDEESRTRRGGSGGKDSGKASDKEKEKEKEAEPAGTPV